MKSSSARRTVRRRNAVLTTALAICLAGVASVHAQSTTPITLSRAPVFATGLSPGDTMLIGDIPGFQVTLHWRAVTSRSETGLPPVRVSSFQVCFYETGTTHDCRARTGVIAMIDVAGNTLTARAIESVPWWDRFFRKRTPDMEYDYVATLPAAALDKPLEWIVIACGGVPKASCSQSTSRRLSFTARDIAIPRIDSQRDSALGVAAYIEVRNDGRTSNEPFVVETTAWEVLPDANGTAALREITDPSVRDTDTVVTASGATYSVQEYRRDGRPTDDIRGFHRAGFGYAQWVRHEPEVPPGVPAGQPLQAGTCLNATDPCPTLPMRVLNCDGDLLCWLAPQRTQRPAAFVMHSIVNRGNDYDFDKADNQDVKGRIILN